MYTCNTYSGLCVISICVHENVHKRLYAIHLQCPLQSFCIPTESHALQCNYQHTGYSAHDFGYLSSYVHMQYLFDTCNMKLSYVIHLALISNTS